jgi:hypothetical protein
MEEGIVVVAAVTVVAGAVAAAEDGNDRDLLPDTKIGGEVTEEGAEGAGEDKPNHLFDSTTVYVFSRKPYSPSFTVETSIVA